MELMELRGGEGRRREKRGGAGRQGGWAADLELKELR